MNPNIFYIILTPINGRTTFRIVPVSILYTLFVINNHKCMVNGLYPVYQMLSAQ